MSHFKRDVSTDWTGVFEYEQFAVRATGKLAPYTVTTKNVDTISFVDPGVQNGAYTLTYTNGQSQPELSIGIATTDGDRTCRLNIVDVDDKTSKILIARCIQNKKVISYSVLNTETGPVTANDAAFVGVGIATKI